MHVFRFTRVIIMVIFITVNRIQSPSPVFNPHETPMKPSLNLKVAIYCSCILLFLNIFSSFMPQATMKGGFIYLEPTKELSGDHRDEEDAIMSDSYLSDHSSMMALRDEFIKEHNVLLALSTHGPM